MYILIIILSITVIYMIILKIVGSSPTLDQINLTLTALIGSALITIFYKFGRFEGEIREFKKITLNTFSNIKEDLNKIKRRR